MIVDFLISDRLILPCDDMISDDFVKLLMTSII